VSVARLTVALAGNPNCGKTTIFNNITGSRQHVGNYPGVTVERREGFCRFQGKNLLMVDLPGTYSLTAYSLDEVVARNFIVDEKPDIIVNILDTSNLERNLYLAAQLLELERPMVLALNMADVAEKMGMKINESLLSQKLGVPIVRTVGNRNQGMEELLQAAVELGGKEKGESFKVNYGPEVEEKISELVGAFASVKEKLRFPQRWLAIKLLENDKAIVEEVGKLPDGSSFLALAESARRHLSSILGDDTEVIIADRRYRFVGEVFQSSVTFGSNSFQTTSDKIDKILTNRLYGLPIFLGLMWLLFNIVFTVGAYPQGWIEEGMTWFGEWVGTNMPDGDLKSLIVDGIIGGVGGVIVFLPNILLLFFGIALLEDTGYMARAAFIMDRIMRAVGLHGKSFIPLLIGFGCSVPAIMGTRTLENPRDRLVTILVAPLMSCSARLPVYTVLIGAFFAAETAGTVLFSIYLLGIVLAIIMALIFRKALFPGAVEPFVMELPPYHIPTLRSVLTHMWERSVLYLRKAGTIILAVSIVVWFLTNYPTDVQYSKDYDDLKVQAETAFTTKVGEEILAPLGLQSIEDNVSLQSLIEEIGVVQTEFEDKTEGLVEGSPEYAALEVEKDNKLKELEAANTDIYSYAASYVGLQQELTDEQDKLDKEQTSEKLAGSYAGQFGQLIEPVIKPLGFDWKIGVGLFAAFTAKEVLVSTLGTIYSVGEADETSIDLQQTLAADSTFNPLVAYALMAFVLIYSPCLATVAVIRRETNSWKWALFSPVYATALAWFVAYIIYTAGRALGY